MTAGRRPRNGENGMSAHHAALIETMILVSAADAEATDAEIEIIGDIVDHLPVFRDYDTAQLGATLQACQDLLTQDDGLEKGLQAIKNQLPPRLRETAYALACDVIAADGEATQEELRVLELLADRLGIDRLIAAGIERGARARFVIP
jgi:tellurite resistance protein